MNIGIDLMGGDNPQEIIKAINNYIKVNQDKLTIFTTKDNKNLVNLATTKQIEIIYCETEIAKDDDPAFVVRTKKDSTMAKGAAYLKEQKIDAFISAGNTGALVACGVFITKRLKSVAKPALPGFLPRPNAKTPVMLLDLGANISATKDNLLEYAQVANIYMQNFYGITNPSIKLLNNGVEANKGTDLYKTVYQSLSENKTINFQGNIEAREALVADCDIILMDGWSGNILLKSIEGTVGFLGSSMKSVFYKNLKNKLAALTLKKDLELMYNKLDYRELGATPILGVNVLFIKSNGSYN
ncbi:MAG: phosphate acyltransferase PlsX [Mycoplasmatales bacterium]